MTGPRGTGSGVRTPLESRLRCIEQTFSASVFSPRWWVHRNIVRRVRAWAEGTPGTVWEIGSGDGKWGRLFPGRHRSLDHLAAADTTPGARPPDLWGDALRLPMRGGSVDAVLCASVLEHVTDPETLVRECARVLRPGGRMLLQGPGDLLVTHGDPHHYFNVTRYGYRLLFERAGLAVESESIPAGTFATLWEVACDRLTRHPAYSRNLATRLLQAAVVLATAPAVPFVNLLCAALDAVTPADPRGFSTVVYSLRRPAPVAGISLPVRAAA